MALKVALSSHSFHRFGWGPEGDQKLSLLSMTERCAELVDGIELLGNLSTVRRPTLSARSSTPPAVTASTSW
jgi:hypothetical protein